MIDSNFICKMQDIILNAMKKINVNEKGIVFIVDNNQKLCGVLTDGDIRRALLDGIDLQDQISQIVTGEYVYASQEETVDQIAKKIKDGIKVIPIVNCEFRIIDYFQFSNNIRVPVSEPYLRGNEFKYVIDALLSTWISSNGQYVNKFEKEFSSFCECNYGVATSNGTSAIHLALLALGIKKGDEVIVPDLTFAATINSVLYTGATPVIVDVEQESWCINPIEVEKAITHKTKAIIPVHLYGQPCDMNSIMEIAKKYNLFVIEDCAEAHGAEFSGKKVGAFGDIGCFSFYGNKVITTGEGGMCTTNSKELNDKMRLFRDHGMSKSKRYWHDVIGYNYRMTNIQAAIGLAQLEQIEYLLEKRNEVEAKYRMILSNVKNIKLQKNNIVNRKKITWLVSGLIDIEKREFFIKKFGEKGIEVRSFFYALSQMDIYKKYVFSNETSTQISKMGINLPTRINMTEEEISNISNILKEYINIK